MENAETSPRVYFSRVVTLDFQLSRYSPLERIVRKNMYVLRGRDTHPRS